MDLREFLEIVGGDKSQIVVHTEQQAIEAVKQNGHALQYVKDQSETICIEAVKRNGLALQYVKDQSETICIEAVKQNSYALRYVNEAIFTQKKADATD